MEMARYFCPIVNKYKVSWQIFIEVPKSNYKEILSVGAELTHTTDGRANMTKQTGHIWDYSNALKGASKGQPNFVTFRLKRQNVKMLCLFSTVRSNTSPQVALAMFP